MGILLYDDEVDFVDEYEAHLIEYEQKRTEALDEEAMINE